ncbi:extracellular solute-binding protein [Lapidilactobacillus gannanensis]|uniref:Extracellular solute-binding protein n=1 Tax=Lapidilactobacillus gannanensis TaxID=2486002 RepID=A0ABW4BMF1_9LACO|nr:extracellular solute-binding protein [Lapidilactobacillus gannanensis]MCH4057946.1 extracellular solute-binding protein [Lactobacillaceae bacterium]
MTIRVIKKLKNWKHYIFIGENAFALPADPSIQMMLYRKDVFDNPVIQKAAFEETGTPLLPPQSYLDLQHFCTFFNKLKIPEKPVPHPLQLVTGVGNLVSSEFLPYFFAGAGSIELTDNYISISPDAFVATLNNYRKIHQTADHTNSIWWDNEIDAFNNNKTALIIGYTNHLNQVKNVDYSFAPIPGNTPALGGGVIGITKKSHYPEICELFLTWLYQYRIQEQLALLGVCIPETDFFEDRHIFRQFPFLSQSSSLLKTGQRCRQFNNGAIVNTFRLEQIVGKIIIHGIETGVSSSEILSEITKQLNIDQPQLVQLVH